MLGRQPASQPASQARTWPDCCLCFICVSWRMNCKNRSLPRLWISSCARRIPSAPTDPPLLSPPVSVFLNCIQFAISQTHIHISYPAAIEPFNEPFQAIGLLLCSPIGSINTPDPEFNCFLPALAMARGRRLDMVTCDKQQARSKLP